jgi:SAM-dependent methyltransferase
LEYHQQRYARALEGSAFTGCRWLDLGAGARLHGGWGDHRPAVVANVARYIVGCDVVTSHLRRHPNLTFRISAIGEHLPFPDNSFDLVTANMVLEHLEHPALVFQEVARILAPNGRFIFVTPNRGHPAVLTMSILFHPRWRRWLALMAERRMDEHIFRTYYKANTPGRIQQLARTAGLRVHELERFCSYPMTSRIPVLRHLERAWIAATDLRWGASLRSNLIGQLSKPEAGAPISVAGASGLNPGRA